jgi:hypothetical protein
MRVLLKLSLLAIILVTILILNKFKSTRWLLTRLAILP